MERQNEVRSGAMRWLTLGASVLLGVSACSGDDGSPSSSNGTADDGAGTDDTIGGNDGAVANDGADGAGDGTEADENVCDEHVLRTDRVVPDILIVLDRSSSMKGNGVNRWDPSVSGIEAITARLESAVRFGLSIFPGPDQPGIASGCSAGVVDVAPNIDNALPIASVLEGMGPQGHTPTPAALAVAHDAMRTEVAPDQLVSPKYVLLVTDGAPTCLDGEFTAGGGGGGVNQTIVDATVAEIEKMTADDIKTYVLGYDTKSDAALSASLDQMAKAGGTGDTAHRAIENEDELVTELESIAGLAVSCEYVLEEAPKDPAYVLVEVDGMQLNLGAADGWVLGDDGRTVTVQGSPCDALKGGGDHVLSVKVLCDVVAPI